MLLINISKKTTVNPNNIYFLANGKKINPLDKVESHIIQINKESNKIKVLVQLIEEETKKNTTEKSKEIICPTCKEPFLIRIENFKIKLFDCINNHEIEI